MNLPSPRRSCCYQDTSKVIWIDSALAEYNLLALELATALNSQRCQWKLNAKRWLLELWLTAKLRPDLIGMSRAINSSLAHHFRFNLSKLGSHQTELGKKFMSMAEIIISINEMGPTERRLNDLTIDWVDIHVKKKCINAKLVDFN